MPCNPAVGGTAKGQLVREIDALGGLMGRAIDATGIQFKVLNQSRGPGGVGATGAGRQAAVRALGGRRPADRAGITILEGQVARLTLDAGGCLRRRVREPGAAARRRRGGHDRNVPERDGPRRRRCDGRRAEWASRRRSISVSSCGRLAFTVGRLKTGTPPRLSHASIDFERAVERRLFHVEHGDDPATPLSFMTTTAPRNAVVCWKLHSSADSHAAVRRHIARSPLYNGQIQGIGPRYCPSFEDKVMRFPDRDRHLIHLEPEGLDVDEIYVNGMSMSLPEDVQREIVGQSAWPRARRRSCGPATPSSTTSSSRRSFVTRSRRAGFAACSWPGRSTAPPATRRPPARALLAGANAALAVRQARSASSLAATRAIWV